MFQDQGWSNETKTEKDESFHRYHAQVWKQDSVSDLYI